MTRDNLTDAILRGWRIQPLTNKIARLPVPPAAIARQRLLAQTSDQAGRSLEAFLKSPIGRKSKENKR